MADAIDVTVEDTDVLVVGGGAGGARAALAAREAGAKTLLAVKGWFGPSGYRGAGATGSGGDPQWGWSTSRGVPGKPDEEEELNVNLVLQAGLGMADPKLVRSMVSGTGDAARELEEWGLVITKNIPTSDRRRFVRTYPGLQHRVRAADIELREQCMITDLLVQDGECVGAVGINEVSGAVTVFRAKATILATGGDGHLYSLNCYPNCVTGDGYALGYRAGAELINLEFMQAFLVATLPIPTLLHASWTWTQRPKLTNSAGEEIVSKYLPAGATIDECYGQKRWHNPFSTRNSLSRYIDIAIMKEVLAGRGGPNGGCFLSGLDPAKINPAYLAWHRSRGVDPTSTMEISSAYQCASGGICIDENAESAVPGLYAVGEVAAGMHGADRLGGHQMVNTQVFGRRGGRHAAARAKQASSAAVRTDTSNAALKRIADLRAAKGDTKPAAVRAKIQRSNWEKLLILRSDKSLSENLRNLEAARTESLPRLTVGTPSELVEALELQNMIDVAELVTQAALLRRESRGAHYRDDHPTRDDANWLKVIRFNNKSGRAPQAFALDPNWKDQPDDLGLGGYNWG